MEREQSRTRDRGDPDPQERGGDRRMAVFVSRGEGLDLLHTSMISVMTVGDRGPHGHRLTSRMNSRRRRLSPVQHDDTKCTRFIEWSIHVLPLNTNNALVHEFVAKDDIFPLKVYICMGREVDGGASGCTV